jgi:glycosyltransferase involved in cell wall biosynthesis
MVRSNRRPEVIFVGAFNLEFDATNQASSPGGNQVQVRLIEELQMAFEQGKVHSFSLTPKRTWPFGPLISRSIRRDSYVFPGFINLSGLKRVLFSLRLFARLLRGRYDVVVKYNVTLSEALALSLVRSVSRKTFVCAIIQDVKLTKYNSWRLSGVLERCSLRLCSSFDFLVPISLAIASDFRFAPVKTMVFRGGITRQTEALAQGTGSPLEDVAVFAGGLEPHNGIDVLVNRWIRDGINLKLHVFGKGSLSGVVQAAAERCANIVFHGFRPEHEVVELQRRSAVNFCLRFAKNIDPRYFFPSKFVNVLCSPGAVAVNKFSGLPPELRHCVGILDDDLSNLTGVLSSRRPLSSIANYCERRKWVESNCQWRSVVEELRVRHSTYAPTVG